jgi:hypothetical protein
VTLLVALSLPWLGHTALAQQGAPGVELVAARLPQRNAAGEVRYIVHLDPLYADGFREQATLAGLVQADPKKVPPGRPELEKPQTRHLSALIARTLGKVPERVRSWSGTEFEIHLKPAEVDRLRRTKGVIELTQYDADPTAFTLSVVQPIVNTWANGDYAIGDLVTGNEILPWWKQSSLLGVNDSTNFAASTNYIKVFDGHLLSPLPGTVIADSNIREITQWGNASPISDNDWKRFHATHVLGVINAGANNLLARGVNASHPTLFHGVFSTPYLGEVGSNISNAINNTILMDEYANRWGVATLSLAGNNSFDISHAGGVGKQLARLSNRNVVLESAGNLRQDSCNYGYAFFGAALPLDGVIQVGGYDRLGAHWSNADKGSNQFYYHRTPPLVDGEAGSNYGPCVELWAPAKHITSLRANAGKTQVLSGTSFSAPITAAIAARYGNNQTRPLERDFYLTRNATPTGYTAPDAAMIRSVTHKPVGGQYLTRYPVMCAWSPSNTADIANVFNGKYTDIWNANGNTGQIVVDLGAVRPVRYIRLTPRSSVAPSAVVPISFEVAGRSCYTCGNLGGAFTPSVQAHWDMVPITLSVPNGGVLNTRYLTITAQNTGSWTAYSEIEVYGH